MKLTQILALSARAAVFGLAACTLAACGASPISIHGRVVDDNGSPIPKAEIATEPATDVVVSNGRGFFLLRQRITELGETARIQAGKYRITIRKFGYEDLSFAIPVREGKNVIKQSIVMKERTADMGEEVRPDRMQESETEPDGASVPKIGP